MPRDPHALPTDAPRARVSLLCSGLTLRLAVAGVAATLLWLTVAWALT